MVDETLETRTVPNKETDENKDINGSAMVDEKLETVKEVIMLSSDDSNQSIHSTELSEMCVDCNDFFRFCELRRE